MPSRHLFVIYHRKKLSYHAGVYVPIVVRKINVDICYIYFYFLEDSLSVYCRHNVSHDYKREFVAAIQSIIQIHWIIDIFLLIMSSIITTSSETTTYRPTCAVVPSNNSITPFWWSTFINLFYMAATYIHIYVYFVRWNIYNVSFVWILTLLLNSDTSFVVPCGRKERMKQSFILDKETRVVLHIEPSYIKLKYRLINTTKTKLK